MTGQATRRPVAGTVLVVAKWPVPGLAKTRLAARVGAEAAADLAAAALLDTLDAAHASGGEVVVAFTGALHEAARRDELEAALAGATMIGQRGAGLAERLANAHLDAHARTGSHGAVFQIGMDTPQVTAALLDAALAAATTSDAVLGPATDGGWWGLAVADPRLARLLPDVVMSTGSTGARTRAILEAAGAIVHMLPTLRDVDEWPDALAVADQLPRRRFAAAVARTGPAIQAVGGSEGLM